MTAIKCRDRQNVHEGEDDAQEGRHRPEHVPVPVRREETADSPEASDALRTVSRSEVTEVADIAAQHVPAMLDSGREALEEAIFLLHRFVIGGKRRLKNTQFEVGCQHHLHSIELLHALVLYGQDHRAGRQRILVRILHGHDIIEHAHLIVHVAPCLNLLAIDRSDEVTRLDARPGSRRTAHHTVDLCRDERLDEVRTGLDHRQHIHVAGQRNAVLLAVTQYINTFRLGYLAEEVAVHIGIFTERSLVRPEHDIMVAEAQCLGISIETHTHAHVRHLEIRITPGEHDHRIDEERKDKIDQHATHHDQQPLPCRLGAELPRLRLFLHLLGIKTLVNHTGNLAVAAQRQPAHAVLGIVLFRLPAEELSFPLPDVHIEEDKELFDTDTEEFRKEHMSAFVKQDKQRDCQNKL